MTQWMIGWMVYPPSPVLSFYPVFGRGIESRVNAFDEKSDGTIKVKFEACLAGVVSLCHGIRFRVESREDEEKCGQIDSNRAIHTTIERHNREEKLAIKIEGRAGRVLGRSLYDVILPRWVSLFLRPPLRRVKARRICTCNIRSPR